MSTFNPLSCGHIVQEERMHSHTMTEWSLSWMKIHNLYEQFVSFEEIISMIQLIRAAQQDVAAKLNTLCHWSDM